MKVSIIIPTYNRGKMLELSLQSVLNQTYSDIEIIIVDDGSVDDTSTIVQNYQKKYGKKIRYFFKKNGGVASARNLGIIHAKGEYISFLDSDDLIYQNKIEEQITALKKSRAQLCYCGHYVVEGGHRRTHRINYVDKNNLMAYLRNSTAPHTDAWVIQRKLIEDNNLFFREGCSWGEDMEFFVKILFVAKKITFVKAPLFEYKVHTGGMLSSFSWDKMDKDIYIWNLIADWLRQNVKEISTKRKYERIIYEYRLPALLVYRFLEGIKEHKESETNLKKYRKYIKISCFINGIRSLKLKVYYLKLRFLIFIRKIA